jgi:hypothetical protein
MGKIGGRFDRRAVLDLTDLTAADYDHLVNVLQSGGCLKILPDPTNGTSGQIQILPTIDDFGRKLDEQPKLIFLQRHPYLGPIIGAVVGATLTAIFNYLNRK